MKHIYILILPKFKNKFKYNTKNITERDTINKHLSFPINDFQDTIILRPFLHIDLNKFAFGNIVNLLYLELVNIIKNKL